MILFHRRKLKIKNYIKKNKITIFLAKKFYLLKYLKKLRKKIVIFSLGLGLNYFLPILLSDSSAMACSLTSILISSQSSNYHQINEDNLIIFGLFLIALAPENLKYLGVLILTRFLIVSSEVSINVSLAFCVSLSLLLFCHYNLSKSRYSKFIPVLIPITFLLTFYWHFKLW